MLLRDYKTVGVAEVRLGRLHLICLILNSKISLNNLLLNKSILRPLWYYGIAI